MRRQTDFYTYQNKLQIIVQIEIYNIYEIKDQVRYKIYALFVLIKPEYHIGVLVVTVSSFNFARDLISQVLR